jgi:hypothetical protein
MHLLRISCFSSEIWLKVLMCADMCVACHTCACMQLLLSVSIAVLNTIDAERRRGERKMSMPSVTDNFLSPSLLEGGYFLYSHA